MFYCFFCLGGGVLFFFCLGGGRVYFFAVWAGVVFFCFFLFGRGTRGREFTHLPVCPARLSGTQQQKRPNSKKQKKRKTKKHMFLSGSPRSPKIALGFVLPVTDTDALGSLCDGNDVASPS